MENTGHSGDARRRLYRSRTNRVIGGVCAGIADYFNIGATGVRWATALLVLLAGLSIWVYIVLWIVLPVEPAR